MARTVAALPQGRGSPITSVLGCWPRLSLWRRCGAVLAATGKPACGSAICRRMWSFTTSSLWRCTCRCPIVRCCAVCWKACSGCWALGWRQGGRQVGHLASAHAAGLEAAAAVARRGGEADRGAGHAGRLVSALAAGESGRQYAGGGRRAGERAGLRPARAQSRQQRLPADALCLAGGERHPRAVGQPDGGYGTGEITLAQAVIVAFAQGHAVPGRPEVLRLRAVAAGPRHEAPICSGG